MKTKQMLAAVAITVLCSVGAQAQGKFTAEERATRHTQKMEKELGLSPEQTAKVQALNLERAKMMDTLMVERKAKMQQMKKRHEAFNERYKTILNADQYDKFLKAQEAQRAKMRERMGRKQD